MFVNIHHVDVLQHGFLAINRIPRSACEGERIEISSNFDSVIETRRNSEVEVGGSPEASYESRSREVGGKVREDVGVNPYSVRGCSWIRHGDGG